MDNDDLLGLTAMVVAVVVIWWLLEATGTVNIW